MSHCAQYKDPGIEAAEWEDSFSIKVKKFMFSSRYESGSYLRPSRVEGAALLRIFNISKCPSEVLTSPLGSLLFHSLFMELYLGKAEMFY